MMLTRAKKRQKMEDEKLFSLETVFPHFVEFPGINDATNLGMVCKALHGAVNTSRQVTPWQILKETRRPTMIGYVMKKFDEELGIDFPLEDVTVSQVQPFTFCISQDEDDCHPQKLVARLNVENELWEEIDNRKLQDLEDTSTRVSIAIDSCDAQVSQDLIFDSFSDLGNDVGIRFAHSHSPMYGYALQEFLENGSEEHKKQLKRILSILYACCKRISGWHDEDGAKNSSSLYPSAEYLMRRLPQDVWPFFPDEFDWNADSSDRITVPEFTYHPAPTIQDWLFVTPDELLVPSSWDVNSLPWYRSASG